MSPGVNIGIKLELFSASYFLNVDSCLKTEYFYANLSNVEIRQQHLAVGNRHQHFGSAYNKYPYIFTYATSFHGFRYLVFVDVEQLEKANFVDVRALLRPFPTIVWLLVIASTAFIVLALMVASDRGLQNPVFYTVSLLLEQGDANLQTKSHVIPTVLFVWLFVSFILRLLYTSSVYSFLTVEPELVLPQSFEDCLNETTFFKLGSSYGVHEVFARLSYEYDEDKKIYNASNSTLPSLRLLSQTIYMVQLLEEPDLLSPRFEADAIPLYQIKLLHNHSNTLYAEHLCLHASFDNRYPGIDFCEGQNIKTNRFVYIYNSPVIEQTDKNAMEVFAVILFGGKRVYGNNNPPVFNSLRGWVGVPDLSTQIVDDIAGRLEESGILMRWRTFENILFLLDSWKNIQKKVLEVPTSWNLVQIAYDLIENISVEEL
ncbi:unnamed protein product [Orchesella dallaii]|uniref:Uncharacterized protein n=1 Tax=Orchesella dallaii TaxID=48710 RepID=A0ABP1RHD6_9HEXA